MDLLESKLEFKLKPGSAYRENLLVPIAQTKKVSGALSFLNTVNRSTLSTRILICVAVSTDGSHGVLVDKNGESFIITKEDLKSKLEYINSKFQKTIIPRFVYARTKDNDFKYVMDKFLIRPATARRYKDWESPYGPIGQEVLVEAVSPYEVGKTYVSSDGDFKFLVLDVKSGKVRIQDLKDKKKYTIDLGDLELLRAKVVY